jgi:hypothetical protein
MAGIVPGVLYHGRKYQATWRRMTGRIAALISSRVANTRGIQTRAVRQRKTVCLHILSSVQLQCAQRAGLVEPLKVVCGASG